MSFFDRPLTYDRLEKYIYELDKKHENASLFSIGQSLCKRELYGICIGNTDKVTLFAGAFHAQEWLTASLLLKFTAKLLENIGNDDFIKNAKKRFEQRGIVIIPMINPDGVEIALNGPETAGVYSKIAKEILKNAKRSYQANARGVDLNHNFDAGFLSLKEIERKAGITSPCERQYGGEYPHSEPESKALVQFLKSRTVESVYAFHSQGEEIFYEYQDKEPPQSEYIADIISKESGYSIVKNDGLYSHGGFKDYFIEKYQKPGFTFEIGKGENPLPVSDLDLIYEKIEKALKICAII